jgi:hypothetical protein
MVNSDLDVAEGPAADSDSDDDDGRIKHVKELVLPAGPLFRMKSP